MTAKGLGILGWLIVTDILLACAVAWGADENLWPMLILPAAVIQVGVALFAGEGSR